MSKKDRSITIRVAEEDKVRLLDFVAATSSQLGIEVPVSAIIRKMILAGMKTRQSKHCKTKCDERTA